MADDYYQGRGLTRREQLMLELLADGLTAEETAHALNFAAETVKSHRKAIYRKLGAVNAAHAVHLAHQEGLL